MKKNNQVSAPINNNFDILLNEGEEDEIKTTLAGYINLFDEDMDESFINVVNLIEGESYQYGADNIKRLAAALIHKEEGKEGWTAPEKLDVHSTGLLDWKAELHPPNDSDGKIIFADVYSLKLANEITRRYNAFDDMYRALQALVRHLEWREDFIVEDADENENDYSIAKKLLNRINTK